MTRLMAALAAATLMLTLGCAQTTREPAAITSESRVVSAADSAALDAMRQRLARGQAASLLFFNQDERRVAFRHIDALYPTRLVVAGDAPLQLSEAPVDLTGVTYQVNGETFTLADFLTMPSHMGLIVVQGNKILFEHYANGNNESTKWISFSVTKSVTSMLIGAAIADGYITNVDEPVANYLPRLRGTPYEQATIEDVLHMASGAAWNEDYADPNSDVAKAGGANGLVLVNYLAQLPKVAEPGTTFNYYTGETNLVGEILRAAIGNNASTYLTHKIWQPFGMESDATWLLGGEGGGETGGCCISATLRDYARIGLFAARDGVLADGTRVLPEGWMRESTTPMQGAPFYGYLWWLSGDGSYAAQGIFEQQIYIDPAADLVIATHSNAPTAVGSMYARHQDAVTQALRTAVR